MRFMQWTPPYNNFTRFVHEAGLKKCSCIIYFFEEKLYVLVLNLFLEYCLVNLF